MPTQKWICPQKCNKECPHAKPHKHTDTCNSGSNSSGDCSVCVPVAHKAKPKGKPTLAWGLKNIKTGVIYLNSFHFRKEDVISVQSLCSDGIDMKLVRVQITEVKGRGR
jgi:hypothetical protein